MKSYQEQQDAVVRQFYERQAVSSTVPVQAQQTGIPQATNAIPQQATRPAMDEFTYLMQDNPWSPHYQPRY